MQTRYDPIEYPEGIPFEILRTALIPLVPWELALALTAMLEHRRVVILDALPLPREREIIEHLMTCLGRIRVADVEMAQARLRAQVDEIVESMKRYSNSDRIDMEFPSCDN